MRLLVVDAPGVLYSEKETPPTANPITSGLRLVRALTDGFGVPVLVAGQIPGEMHETQMAAWLKVYDVQHAFTVTDPGSKRYLDFWEEDVMSRLGSMRATPPAVITASAGLGKLLARCSVPTIQYRQPEGKAPDWRPTASTWAAKAPHTEE